MKILNAKQIKEVDSKTITYKGISSRTLMTKAEEAIYKFLKDNSLHYSTINIICGVGNNGGDGISLAIDLLNRGNKAKVYVIEYSKNYSPDFRYFFEQAIESNVNVTIVTSIEQLPNFSEYEIIIDALFGTGLNRDITGLPLNVIEKINQSESYKISIDVPSGLMLNSETKTAIEANDTVTLEIPKLALFMPSNHRYVGNIHIVNIGLSQQALEEANTTQYYMDKLSIKMILKPVSKYAHKGTQGHSLIIGGSIGKVGAVHLASKAALKSGCGLVSAYVPKCGTIPLQSSFAEAMVIEDESHTHISNIKFNIKPNAIGIGIGMGQDKDTIKTFTEFIANTKVPMVVDADAINMISYNRNIINLLPANTILTPHPKELERLIGVWNDDFDKLEKTKGFTQQYKCIVVIKGAHTVIVSPEELYVNSTGTPALATAGSGDVLTGIITGLLAQGYQPLQAAKIAVYLHGLTANVTSDTIHARSFTASDIIDNIGNAYFVIESE